MLLKTDGLQLVQGFCNLSIIPFALETTFMNISVFVSYLTSYYIVKVDRAEIRQAHKFAVSLASM